MEVLLHGRADEDFSNIFASLTESELERELQIADRRLRTPSPTTGGTGQHRRTYSSSDDQGRLASSVVRCAAAFGPQPLSDQDVDTIRKLVSRMATFAAYRACIPGGLEAVENMELWQCKVWTAEAEEHAARMRSQPAVPTKQQQRPRLRGQQQQQPPSASRTVRHRPSARNKNGSSALQQGSSKCAKAPTSGRGSGPAPAASAVQVAEYEAQAAETQKDACGTGRESLHAITADATMKEGSYRVHLGRSNYSISAHAPINATTVWNYVDSGSRHTAQVSDKSSDRLSYCPDESVPQEQLHWNASAVSALPSGSTASDKQNQDASNGKLSLQGALGADGGVPRSHKHWTLSIASDSGVAVGSVAGRSCSLDSSCPPSESLQRAQEAATKEFYSLCQPDAARQHCAVDHPSMMRAVQAHAPSSRSLGKSSNTPNPLELQLYRPNEVDTSQWNLDSGMPAALYGHSVADTTTVVSADWDRRRTTTTTALPSRNAPTKGLSAPSEDVHMHGGYSRVDPSEVGQADSTVLNTGPNARTSGARRRSVNIHTAPAPLSSQQTFGAPRRRFSGADSLSSTPVAKSELGCDWSHAATPGSVRHSGSSVAYQEIQVSPCAAPNPYSSESPDFQTLHAQMYAESLACGQHAPKQAPGSVYCGRERLEPGELASAGTVAERTASSSSVGRRAILEQCMSVPEGPSTVDYSGAPGSCKATNAHSSGSMPAAHSSGMRSCLITGSEVQASVRPHSGARPLSRASSSRRLHRGRSLTPSAASDSANSPDKSSVENPGTGDRRNAGLSTTSSQQQLQGWWVGGIECSNKQTDRSRSFDDSIAVYVPYMGGSAIGHAAAQSKAAISDKFQEQNAANGDSGSASGYRVGCDSDKMPMHIMDPGWESNERSLNGDLTSAQTNLDVSEPPTLRAHLEQLHLKNSSMHEVDSAACQHQVASSEPNRTVVPQQARDKLRESTNTLLQEEVGQGSNVGKTAGPSAGPGALATTVASGQARTRRSGAARGGKRHGHLNCRSGRGIGQPAAPLMLATFEGPAQGEMRARLDAVRKLQEETAAAEARSGRGRRLRR